MSKIVNTTRGLVRPTRSPDETATRDLSVTEPALSPLQGREARPLAPIAPRRGADERTGGERTGDAPPREEGLAPLPGPRALATDLVVARSAAVSAKSPVSSTAVANLVGALEQHGRQASVSHDAALSVLKQLQALIEQVTERRSWPRVPRVRRRVQRRRRDG